MKASEAKNKTDRVISTGLEACMETILAAIEAAAEDGLYETEIRKLPLKWLGSLSVRLQSIGYVTSYGDEQQDGTFLKISWEQAD